MIASALVTLGLMLCAYVCLLLLGDVYLVAIHLRSARRRPAAGQLRRSGGQAGSDADAVLPTVCVQLPVFNEPALVAAAIDSLCALDWPRDRLEIMVLDDSTDDTLAIAAARVDDWQRRGVAIRHIVRPSRQGYKAGALAAGLQHTDAKLLSIFDADYRPAPSFLRQTVPALMEDAGLAFVQARLGYRNRTRNLLTRAQALELDTHFAYEQLGRHRAGVPMTFNGTCGIWRREAIEQAGGWSGRSVAEDQDLSFRVLAEGWRSRFLVDVSADGELPETFEVLETQRTRWSTGTAQVARDLPWSILGRLGRLQATGFVLLTLFHATAATALVAVAIIGLVLLPIEPGAAALIGAGWLATACLIVAARSIGAALAARVLGRPLDKAFFCDVVAMWAMQLALLPTGSKALLSGLARRKVAFRRTPKRG